MLVLHKVLTISLIMAVVKWSDGFFYHRIANLSAFENDTLLDATHEPFASNIENTTDKSIDKRSSDAMVDYTPSNRIDDTNQYTYLNIGVLMASHLGKYKFIFNATDNGYAHFNVLFFALSLLVSLEFFFFFFRWF